MSKLVKCQMQPLPQQAHHGILPPCECEVIDNFRFDVDRWLKLVDDSLDDPKLLQMDVPVDPPIALLFELPPGLTVASAEMIQFKMDWNGCVFGMEKVHLNKLL